MTYCIEFLITFIYDYWKSRSPPTDIIIIQSEQMIIYKNIHRFLGAFNSTMVAKCQHIIGFLLASAATLRSSCCCCSLATAIAAMSDNHHVCMIQLCWYWLRSEQRIGTSLVVGLNTISFFSCSARMTPSCPWPACYHEWGRLCLFRTIFDLLLSGRGEGGRTENESLLSKLELWLHAWPSKVNCGCASIYCSA